MGFAHLILLGLIISLTRQGGGFLNNSGRTIVQYIMHRKLSASVAGGQAGNGPRWE